VQQSWDDIDKIIIDSKLEIEPGPNYNQALFAKIRTTRSYQNENRIPAFSLIIAGVMLLFIHTADLQSNMLEAEYQLKTGITILKQDSNWVNIKYFGE
jgi:hypothetical protein